MEKCSLTGTNLNRTNVFDDVYYICEKHPADTDVWHRTRFVIRQIFADIVDSVKSNET